MTSTTRSQRIHRIGFALIGTALAAGAIFGGHGTASAPTSQPAPIAAADQAPAVGCWTEWKADGTAERMYGNLGLEPAGSTPLDCAAFTDPAAPADGATVEEDEAGFDCRTMGNLVCGAGAQVAGQPVPAGDYSDGDQVAAPVGVCLEALGYSSGPVVRGDAEWCAQQ